MCAFQMEFPIILHLLLTHIDYLCRKFYVYEETMPYDEDMCHEFKGHRNIVLAEVPPHSQRTGSQQPISK